MHVTNRVIWRGSTAIRFFPRVLNKQVNGEGVTRIHRLGEPTRTVFGVVDRRRFLVGALIGEASVSVSPTIRLLPRLFNPPQLNEYRLRATGW